MKTAIPPPFCADTVNSHRGSTQLLYFAANRHGPAVEMADVDSPSVYQRVVHVVAGDLFDDDDDDFVMAMRKAAVVILALGSVALMPLLTYWSIWSAIVFPGQFTSQVGIVSTLTAYFVFITTPAFIYARKHRSVPDGLMFAVAFSGQLVNVILGVVSWLPTMISNLVLVCLATTTCGAKGTVAVFILGIIGCCHQAARIAWPAETGLLPQRTSNAELFLGSLLGCFSLGIGGGLMLAIRFSLVNQQQKYAKRQRNNDAAPKDAALPFAVVFTDIESSTRLWATVPQAMGAALEAHNTLLRDAIAGFGGYEVKTIGDSFMVVFDNALNAVRMALSVQRALLHHDWGTNVFDDFYQERWGSVPNKQTGRTAAGLWRGLRVRIGVHFGLGDVKYDDITKGYDYYGTVVNTAARVEAAACGGQVLATRTVATLLERYQAESEGRPLTVDGEAVVVSPMGSVLLRGLTDRVQLVQLSLPETSGRQFPILRGVSDPDLREAATAGPDSTSELPPPSGRQSPGVSSEHSAALSNEDQVFATSDCAKCLDTLLSVEPTAERRMKTARMLTSLWRQPWSKCRLSVNGECPSSRGTAGSSLVDDEIRHNVCMLGSRLDRVVRQRFANVTSDDGLHDKPTTFSRELASGRVRSARPLNDRNTSGRFGREHIAGTTELYAPSNDESEERQLAWEA